MSDPFSIAAGVIAVWQLSQSIGLFVYGLAGRPELCRRLASELACVEGLMKQLERLDDTLKAQPGWQSKVSVLRPLVESLRVSLEELDARLKKVNAPTPETLAVWPIHERAIKEILLAMERCKSSILIQLHFTQAEFCQLINQRARDIQSGFRDLQNRLELVSSNVSELLHRTRTRESDETAHHREDFIRLARKEREATLAWLTKVSFVPEHNDFTQNWVRDTTQWFFEQPAFLQWKESTTSQILLVLGNAGCGKSMIASRLVEHIKETPKPGPSTLLAYLYCSSKQPAKGDPRALASSLLQQLCQASPLLDESVVHLREQYRQMPNAEPSLSEITKVLVSVVKTLASPCFLVVDGLDECVDGSKLAAIVDKLTKKPAATVKVVIFSRHACPVWPNYFGDVARIIVDHEANRKDIQLYAHIRLGKLAKNTPVLRNEALRSDVVQTLLEKADGMFLWVHLSAESLRLQPTEKSLRKALKQLPRGIEEVFEGLLQRIREQPEATRRLAVRTLNWALNARRPLHVQEMIEAIAVEREMLHIDDEDLLVGDQDLDAETQLMAYCAGLVILDPKQFVQLLHWSLKAVLRGHKREAAAGHHAGLPLSEFPHLDLARVCVAYLSLENFAGPWTSSPQAIDDIIDRHPFLRYAARNWAWHASKAEVDTSFLHDQILKLLSQRHRMNLVLDIILHTTDRSLPRRPDWPQDRNALHFIAENNLIDLYEKFERDELQRLSSSTDSCGYSPLDLSLWHGQHKISLRLLEFESWLSRPESHTPRLHLAVQHGWLDVVEKMLSLRARLDTYDYRGLFPLQVACAYGQGTDMLQLLLNVGPEIINRPSLEGTTSLMIAAEHGKMDMVEYLLQRNADVMAQTEYGQTALHAASRSGHVGVVRLLLQADESKRLLHVEDKYRETPIFDATQNGHKEVIELLLSHGAQRQHSNIAGVTPLHVAAAYQQFDSFFFLQQDMDDFFQQDSSGWSPFDILMAMLDCDNLSTSGTATPNGLEVPKERLDALFRQLAHQKMRTNSVPDVMTLTKHLRTFSLHIAAASGSKDSLIRTLTESHNDIWQVDPWGRTAYDLAIGEHREEARSLIRAAAKSSSWGPPQALHNTHPELVNLSNQSYLQKTGLNFCLFVMCEVCKEHVNQCHWLHCKLCSKLGEGWDICERCFRKQRDAESLCPSKHGREDLQLLFIANHMISGPMVELEHL